MSALARARPDAVFALVGATLVLLLNRLSLVSAYAMYAPDGPPPGRYRTVSTTAAPMPCRPAGRSGRFVFASVVPGGRSAGMLWRTLASVPCGGMSSRAPDVRSSTSWSGVIWNSALARAA